MVIEELREQVKLLTEETRLDRISRGLPPEEPDDFVELPLSMVLAERLKQFMPIAIQYTKVVSSGEFPKVDTSRFETYVEYARLLNKSKGYNCRLISSGVLAFIKEMDRINNVTCDEEENEDILRDLHFFITSLIDNDPWDDTHDYLNGKRIDVREEYRSLVNNEALFNLELKKAQDHYESIKHLI
jgi:hypothetical protein